MSREVHSGRISEADGRHQVAAMVRLPIQLIEHPSLYTRAFDMARALGWGKAYDALYLATADLERAELLTLDGGMGEAAARLEVRCAVVGGSGGSGVREPSDAPEVPVRPGRS